MRLKILFIVGLGVGYLLGARAGRPRYEQMKAKATDVWEDPRVQKAVSETQDFVKENAPLVQEKVVSGTKAAVAGAQDAAVHATEFAKDLSGKVAETSKDISDRVAEAAKDVSGRVSETSKDISGKVAKSTKDASAKAKDASKRVAQAAHDASDAVSTTAKNVRTRLLDRGEEVVDGVIIAASQARDEALDVNLDDDEK